MQKSTQNKYLLNKYLVSNLCTRIHFHNLIINLMVHSKYTDIVFVNSNHEYTRISVATGEHV